MTDEANDPENDCIVYLMRGLPSCGKSWTARRLAGASGLVLETDQYFYTEVGNDESSYDYSESLLPEAREWIYRRLERALAERVSPIVVDRGNGLNPETKRFADCALRYGYALELREPDSPWWAEVRVLLKYRNFLDHRILDTWAERLAMQNDGHGVSAKQIRKWMDEWRYDVTIERILNQ
jgi:hypothetical protein